MFITNVVKCRPPDNRDPQPDEIAACAPYLRRQLEVLDPAVVVTLGRFSMATFMPGARISQAHGTVRPVDPGDGRRERARLRDVPPGGRAADAGHRTRELRRHRRRPGRAARLARARRERDRRPQRPPTPAAPRPPPDSRTRADAPTDADPAIRDSDADSPSAPTRPTDDADPTN